jgi:hypothetical protein
MPPANQHTTNRRAFAARDKNDPLLCLYLDLVALELCLKDTVRTNFQLSHDVCQMATQTFPMNPGVSAAAVTLRGDLNVLRCSDRSGGPTTVRHHIYPDLRYLRLDLDFTSDASSIAEVMSAHSSLTVLIQELRNEGLPWP